MNNRVIVALSGGVDSAAAVLLLRDAGYDVEAVTFDLLGDAGFVSRAGELAEKLGVPWRVEDLRAEFRDRVVDYFIDGYMRGQTPAPCSVCNPLIKWASLLNIARREGFDRISTGHYCRIVRRDELWYVAVAKDPVKDQSYYLWGLGQDVLSRAITPLGDYTKAEIKEMMSDRGFADVSSGRESMGVCFLGGGGYAAFLEKNVPAMPGPGEVVDAQGRVVGSHRGFPYYTVGQKRGFDIFGSEACGDMYVTGIDAARNRLTVGEISQLNVGEILLGNFMTADLGEILSSERLRVKIRGIGINPEGCCTAAEECGMLWITIPGGAYAPAPGQPAALYIDDRVVGGGTILMIND